MSYDPDMVSQGIILYSRMPTRHMITLFDCVRGKLDCQLRMGKQIPPLAHGTLVEYRIHEQRDMFVASFIEPLAVPNDWVREDIYFLHHVLELCNIFIPLHQASKETYTLLSALYSPFRSTMRLGLFKKVFLCKLHTLLGMYPAEEVHDPFLSSLISCAGDSMFELHYDTEIESRLAMWLYQSLHAANAHDCLKTFSFVKRLDIHYENT
jgi:hypothetical protein